jgi:HYR domain
VKLRGLVLSGLLLAALLGGRALADPPGHVISVPSDITAEATSASGASVTFAVTVTPNDETASCDHNSGDTFSIGTTTVTCSAPDADDASFHITVQDTTPPTVSVPSGASGTTTTPGGTAVVTWSPATASDTVDGSLTPTCNHNSGDSFPVGTTTVTCTATDSHGNTGSKSFDVTVTFTDTTPPAFTSVPNNTTIAATSAAGAVYSYSVSATDDSGTVNVTCSPASGSVFPPTTTTVNCTASDPSGNHTGASWQVTVTPGDFAPPVFSNVPASKTVEANSAAGSIVNYAMPTANDAVDGPELVSCAPVSGTTFPLRTTTVTCTSTDAHGNTATASFAITVADRTPPSLTVPADRAVYADTPTGISAQSHYAAEFLSEAQAVDAVDPHPRVSSDSPDFFTVGVHLVTFAAIDASGNGVTKGATLDVRPMPPAGTRPLPTPTVRTAPNDVTALKADAGDGRVRLSWQIPDGVDHVVITHQLSDGGDPKVVYTGSGKSFTDKGLINGLEYRFVVTAVDKSGNTSAGAAITALPKATLLRSPKDGAKLSKPPKLVWVRNSEASYYNVQLFRGNVKLLSTWPTKANIALSRKWKYNGHKYTLSRGTYRWYVWPGFGARANVDYGDMLGFSTFQIVR